VGQGREIFIRVTATADTGLIRAMRPSRFNRKLWVIMSFLDISDISVNRVIRIIIVFSVARIIKAFRSI
jgi:hypothetical protein